MNSPLSICWRGHCTSDIQHQYHRIRHGRRSSLLSNWYGWPGGICWLALANWKQRLRSSCSIVIQIFCKVVHFGILEFFRGYTFRRVVLLFPHWKSFRLHENWLAWHAISIQIDFPLSMLTTSQDRNERRQGPIPIMVLSREVHQARASPALTGSSFHQLWRLGCHVALTVRWNCSSRVLARLSRGRMTDRIYTALTPVYILIVPWMMKLLV